MTFTALMVTNAPQGQSPWYLDPWAAMAAQLDANFAAVGGAGWTSETSFLIGNGIKTFTVDQPTTGLSLYKVLYIYSAANRANAMVGEVTGVTATTVSINVRSTAGSGTHADWIIVPAAVFAGSARTVQAISGNYTVLGSDAGSLLQITTGSPTITMLAPSTAASGFELGVQNIGTGSATVSVSGGATISGLSSVSLAQYQSIETLVNAAATAYEVTAAFGLPATGRTGRTSNTILAGSDNLRLIDVTSGTFTQTLTAAATLGGSWSCYFRNTGTGIVTIDPNASETIDGRATINVYTGESFQIICDGSNFYSVGRIRTGGRVFLTSTTGSGGTSIDFSGGMFTDTELSEIQFDLQSIRPVSNSIVLQFTTNGALITTGYNYAYSGFNSNNAAANLGSTNQSFVRPFGSALSSNAADGISGTFKIPNFSSATVSKNILFSLTFNDTTTPILIASTGGATNTSSVAAITTVRFTSTSGSALISSGTINMYGIRT